LRPRGHRTYEARRSRYLLAECSIGPGANSHDPGDLFQQIKPRSAEPRSGPGLAAVGKAPLSRILAFAAERGWRRLRLLSSAGSTYNRDDLAQTTQGHQRPLLNVFHRDGETIRHFWGSELLYAPTEPGQDPRHVDTIEPL
jgi:hypothetical protein